MKNILKGAIANKGEVKGQAFVIKNFKDIFRFKENSILVARVTDPSYVLAMVKAAGIITDIGGITSHAAIVARELGVPCVVGTKEATKKLKTGQRIILNANKGEIYAE